MLCYYAYRPEKGPILINLNIEWFGENNSNLIFFFKNAERSLWPHKFFCTGNKPVFKSRRSPQNSNNKLEWKKFEPLLW